MSQYINLYRDIGGQEPALKPRYLLLGVLVLALLGQGVYGWFLARDTGQLRAEAEALATQATASRTRLVDTGRRLSQVKTDPGAFNAVMALEARLQARGRLLEALDSGALGNRDGFGEYLRALGRRAGQGVWLTGITVGQGGASLGLSGRSMEAERIPAYLASLNGEPVFKGRNFAMLRIQQVAEAGGKEGAAVRDKAAPLTGGMVEFSLGSDLERDAGSADPKGARK